MPSQLANKIAAGEVIQRPGSVVRELIDNAVDAGADHIEIIIENAGRTLIQVIDNGCGMGREDLHPCFLQHATSKISEIEDLHKIRTMGFRGEAMPSIASIARVEVKTRRHEDDSGWRMVIEGGSRSEPEPVATPPGTSVSVRNLFYNVPARRRFLKKDVTEFRHILQAVHQAALAYPGIAFDVTADREEVHRLPATTLMQRIPDLLGRRYSASLIPFEEETSYVSIRGVLGDPKLSKKSRGEQFIFVNNRPVQHRFLTHVIHSLYESFIGEREYPFFALYLDLDPAQVDVNVHPAKLEVKFGDEQSIIRLTRSVVKKALNQYLLIPGVEEPSTGAREDFSTSFGGLDGFSSHDDSNRSSGTAGMFSELEADSAPGRQKGNMQIPSRINFDRGGTDGLEIGEKLYGREKESPVAGDVPDRTRDDVAGESSEADRRGRTRHRERSDTGFWQLHERYILTQTRTGLCLVDQNRAHMRIIYEKALSATEEALPGTQQLLFAQTMEFSATEFALLKELLPIILQMGFSVQLLSGHTAMINGVPADIDMGDEQTVLREILQEYRELDSRLQLDARKKVAVAFSARTAIPHGRQLASLEMETLIDQLFACDEPYTDPFGKPTLIYLPMEDIRRRFR